MTNVLPIQHRRELLTRGFSRRSFGRFATLLGAGAATLPFYNEPAMAQLSNIGPLPPGAVKINANENPLGPCPEAAEAIHNVVQKGGRYLYEETFSFSKTLAEQEGLKPEYVMPFAGSSDPLHRTVMAFTSPAKSFVSGDPGYEAGARAAEFVGAKVVRVHLQAGQVVSSSDFVTGWLPPGATSTSSRWGRPVNLLVLPDGTLLVSDDDGGRIWRVKYGN